MLRKRSFRLSIFVALIVLLASSMVALAAPAQRSVSPVFVFLQPDNVIEGAESTLVRTDNGISMTYKTSGLEPGTVATIWWVIFNEPENCIVSNMCTPDDVVGPNNRIAEADISVFFAAGTIIGGSGKAHYAAGLQANKLTVDPDPAANQLIDGDGILKNPRGAEVHLVLRSHGPKIPGLVHQQLKTFDAGCTTAPPALQGPNTCMNLQASVHLPH
jgi:hypothetical protein